MTIRLVAANGNPVAPPDTPQSVLLNVLNAATADPAFEGMQEAMVIVVDAQGEVQCWHSSMSQPERNWLLDKAKQSLMDEEPE